MLYYLLSMYSSEILGLSVVKYITFRAGVGMLTALLISFLLSPWFIRKLKHKQIGQSIRDDGPKSHLSKAGTPTMGGGLILFAVLIPALLWMDLGTFNFWAIFVLTCGYGIVGFIDDYLKISKKNSKGLSGRLKLFYQISLALAIMILYHLYIDNTGTIHFPFLKNVKVTLGMYYIPFAILVIVGSSNAVNLTDGLDGLAIGPVMTSSACFAVLAYVVGHKYIAEYLNYPYIPNAGELSIFAACMIGAGLGFLWYNTYPAQVFMGDVGSLPLGGALGMLAVLTKHEVLLALIGGIFVLVAVSVIFQVASFKLTGKRIFRMAPIHHHFELKGWPEPKIIVRFWIISIILALLSLLTLKIR